MFWKRLFSFFIPSPGALTIMWAALIATLLLTLTSIVIALAEPDLRDSAFVIISLAALPVGVLLLTIGTVIERKPGGRFLLWGFATGMIFLSLVGLIFSLQDSSSASDGTGLVILCFCLPVLMVPFLILAFLGWKAYPAFRQTLHAARSQRLIEMIQARGEVAVKNLCAELSLSEEQTLKLVKELITAGELMAYLDLENHLVYSAAALSEKQRRLLAIVNTQGKSALEELARELKVTRELVRQWTYSLVERKQLHGFADWAGGYIYSQDVEQVLAQNQCPHCGGRLGVAGKGLIQCEFCGVEVFL